MPIRYQILFGSPRLLAEDRDAIEYLFPFSMINAAFLGTPEEKSKITIHQVKVGITGTLHTCWGLKDDDLVRVLFEHGKRYIVQKLKDGSLTSREEIMLATSNSPQKSHFDPKNIPNPDGANFNVNIENTDLSANLSEVQVGTQIAAFLDNINARIHDRYGEDLFIPLEFRAPLDLIRPATSRDEFTVRVITLAHIIERLNLSLLRKITSIDDKKMQSISLLDKHLCSLDGDYTLVIKTFRNLVSLSNGYPRHTDKDSRVINAHNYFQIGYYPSDYQSAWLTLLNFFLEALEMLKIAVATGK